MMSLLSIPEYSRTRRRSSEVSRSGFALSPIRAFAPSGADATRTPGRIRRPRTRGAEYLELQRLRRRSRRRHERRHDADNEAAHHRTSLKVSSQPITSPSGMSGTPSCFMMLRDCAIGIELTVGLPLTAVAGYALRMESASTLIDQRIRELGDWRGQTLARVRQLIHDADPDIVEEWKWAKATSPGTPVWSHGGIVCTGETY
jgi:hypothetical protein